MDLWPIPLKIPLNMSDSPESAAGINHFKITTFSGASSSEYFFFAIAKFENFAIPNYQNKKKYLLVG